MRILVVNVNTTETMTASIGASARAVAAPGHRDRAADPAVRRGVGGGQLRELPGRDRGDGDGAGANPGRSTPWVQAGYGEHGREGLQELLDVPVVDITEAAAQHRHVPRATSYSVVTTWTAPCR